MFSSLFRTHSILKRSMMSRSLPLLIMASALIVTFLQTVWYAPYLPDEVASHFDGNGFANGWMSKNAFLATMCGLQVGLAAMFIGLGWSIKKMPPSMINIPNRDYWLHEDRAESTIEFNRDMLNWIGALTAILLVLVFQLSIQANLGNEPKMSMVAFWVILSGYLFLILGMCGWLVGRFSRIPRESVAESR